MQVLAWMAAGTRLLDDPPAVLADRVVMETIVNT
jgi:hypothetical protein